MGSPAVPARGDPAGDIRDTRVRLGRPALEEAFTATDLPALRTAVAEYGSGLGLADRRVDDLVLVAHELACNAVRHGHATRGAPARLRLWRAGPVLICQVSDDGPGLDDPAHVGQKPVSPSADHGRGLWIIRQVAESVDVFSGPGGATVTATMALAGA